MKGNLEHLLRERFLGHEAPVDPGVWDAIQGQLTQAAPTTDAVNDLFRERFTGHESPVDPSVWNGVSKQLGHAPAGIGTWGWVAATAGVLIVGSSLWFSATPVSAPPSVAELNVTPTTPQVNLEVAQAEDPSTTPEMNTEFTANRSKQSNVPPSVVRPAAPVTSVVPSTPGHEALTSAMVPDEQIRSAVATPAPEPLLVEEIIQQITERTVNEVRAQPEGNMEDVDIQVVTDPDPIPATAPPEIFLPNTFTPNGDQVNDTYVVDQEGFRSMVIRVLALKNDKLVFSSNTGEPWTGEGCEDGMYVVVVEAISTDGRPVSKAKVVWLNRDRMN